MLGGIGFGFFIDELGKFITEDNDYFFKPAAGIIYLIFITMFLVIRELSRRQRLDQRTALANALAFLPSTVTGEFRHSEYEVGDRAARPGRPGRPTGRAVPALLRPGLHRSDQSAFAALAWVSAQHRRITAFTERPHFEALVIVAMVVWALLSMLGAAAIEIDIGDVNDGARCPAKKPASRRACARSRSWSRSDSSRSAIYRMRRGQHQRAYRAFSLALLVSIFVTRFFSFLDSQFAAVFGLGVDLLLYASIAELASRTAREGQVRRPRGCGAGQR